MPQLNKSEAVRVRSRLLLQRLIAFANHELTDCDHLDHKISVRWLDPDTTAPKLIVKTEIRFLAALVSPTVTAKTKAHLKQDLRSLKDFLGILEDNRDRTQGTGLWHFTLKLQSRSVEKNLAAFDALWQKRKAVFQAASAQKIALKKAEIPASPASEASSQPQLSQAARSNPAATPEPTTANPATYHNLPARDYGTFAGRAQVLQQLLDFLSADHPVARISLTGIGGIGKTALAIEAAHRCLAQRQAASLQAASSQSISSKADTFSALIFASAKMQRFTPQGILPSYRYSQTLQDILRAIAQTLQHPHRLTGDFEHQLENSYELLSWQRTLLVIDNLDSLSPADQQSILSFLYELPTTVKAIVTSRTQLTMDAVIPLQPLSEKEALQFIHHQSTLKALTLSESALRTLYRQTGGIPAAMVYALGQAAAGYPMPQVLPQLSQKDSDYCQYYLQSTVDSLESKPGYSVLLALSLFQTSATEEALAAIAQLSTAQTVEGIASLQQLALLRSSIPDHQDDDGSALHARRFSMLSLTREYLLTQLDSQVDSQASSPLAEQPLRERWLAWYRQWLAPYRQLNWREWHDYSAIDQEWENLQAVVEWCISTDRDEAFAQLWESLRGYTHLRGYWNERLGWITWWLETARKEVETSTSTSAVSMVIMALRDLGWTLTLMGQPHQLEAARAHFSEAWDYRHKASVSVQLDLAIESAILCLFQNQLASVSTWLATAGTLLVEANLLPEQAIQQQTRIDYYTAQLHYRQENYDQARAGYQRLLTKLRAADTPVSAQQAEVYVLNWLVDIAIQCSDIEEAERLLAQSWPMIQNRKDKRSQAFHQRSKAQLEGLRGNLEASQHWAQKASASFTALGMESQAEDLQAWLKEKERYEKAQ